MAQPSVYFSAGRLTMLQRNVLDAAGMERLLSTASLPEARKTLSELGWTGADITDPEQLAADRVNQAAQDARALSPEPALVDCFLYAYDAANLKMLLKARLLGLSAPALSDCGTIPVDTLRHAVTDHRYSTLPAAFRDAMNRLEQNIVTGIDPMSIDVAIDRAMYQLIFSRLKGTHSPVTLQYFRGHVDLLNAVALLRVRQMKKDEAFFMSVLLDGGTIRAQSWRLCFAQPDMLRAQSWRLCFAQPDMLSAMLAPYGASVTEAAKNAVMDGKRLPALEKAMDDALLEMYRPFRFQICPERAAAYFLAVQRETAAVRLILAGKQNGFDAENIRERLRDLYV